MRWEESEECNVSKITFFYLLCGGEQQLWQTKGRLQSMSSDTVKNKITKPFFLLFLCNKTEAGSLTCSSISVVKYNINSALYSITVILSY